VTPAQARRRQPSVLAAGLGVALLALAGCGAGRYNETFRERPSQDPTNADFGSIELRNAAIAHAAKAGEDVLASFSLYSRDATNSEPDVLVSVTARGLSDQPLQLESVDGGVATPVRQVPVLPQPGTGSRLYAAMIRDLAKPLLPATYHEMTFTFARAGAQTVQVPVRIIGEVAPGATSVPSFIPDSPHPVGSSLPFDSTPTPTPAAGTPTPVSGGG